MSGGGALTINGVVYPKGIGANSISTVVVAMPAGCTTFTSTVGLDIGVGAGKTGSVTFSISGDGSPLLTTPVIKGGPATAPIASERPHHRCPAAHPDARRRW